MEKPEKTLLLFIKYSTLVTSAIIFLYIFVVHFIKILKPVETFIDPTIFNINQLRFIFSLGLLLAFISWIIAFALKQMTFATPFSYTKREITILSITAFLFAVFYNPVFSILGILQYPFFLVLIAIFFLFLPQIIKLYSNFQFIELKFTLKNLLDANKTKIMDRSVRQAVLYLFFLIFITFSLGVVAFSFFYISSIARDYAKGKTIEENINRKNFYIKQIKPEKAMHTQLVELKGYHFGFRTQPVEDYKLMTSGGQINLIEEWTNESINFFVPLELQTGKKQLWLERPGDISAGEKIIKSNLMSFEVFSRFELYPDVDDTKIERGIKKIKKFIFFNIPLLSNIVVSSQK